MNIANLDSQSSFPNPPPPKKKFQAVHTYKTWLATPKGRIPFLSRRNREPDLQSTYFTNTNGLQILRYFRLDIDAKRTQKFWLDVNGAVDWEKIAAYFKKEFDGRIIHSVEYVTRSHSRKGCHVIFGIAPMPLDERSERTQGFIRNIQHELVAIFNELGIGADSGSVGIYQDFSTFRRPENVLYRSEKLTRLIDRSAKNLLETGRINFLNVLHEDCEKVMRILNMKSDLRLHSDLRAEVPLARLYLNLMGLTDTDTMCNGSNIFSLKELAEIMGVQPKSICAEYWRREQVAAIFHIEKLSKMEFRVTLKQGQYSLHAGRYVTRAFHVLKKKVGDFKLRVIVPENVQEGERNTAILNWALALKWHGISQVEAFEHITSTLIPQIPEYQFSQSCKSVAVRATVHSIYRNRRDLFGCSSNGTLPAWLLPRPKEERFAQEIFGRLAPSRSIQPDPVPSLSFPIPEGPHKVLTFNTKIDVVSFKHRIGFFNKGRLFLIVVKNRHYKFTEVVQYIEAEMLKHECKLNPISDFIHVQVRAKRHKSLSDQLYSENAALTVNASTICSVKKTWTDKMQEWQAEQENLACKGRAEPELLACKGRAEPELFTFLRENLENLNAEWQEEREKNLACRAEPEAGVNIGLSEENSEQGSIFCAIA